MHHETKTLKLLKPKTYMRNFEFRFMDLIGIVELKQDI